MGSDGYRIGRLNGKFVLTWWEGKLRKRYRLNAPDVATAHRIAPSIYAELTRPEGNDVETLWEAYCQDKLGRAVVGTMRHTWKSLRDRFGRLPGDSIGIADCRAHVAERRSSGIKDGTIHTELGHLRMVLLWGEKQGLITKASYIERPAKPNPKDAYLTREEVRALIDGAKVPHIRLFVQLAITTGARSNALLGLTWDRVDFAKEMIDLRDPFLKQPHKGRAVVPMNRTIQAALLQAKAAAITPWVIEWAGQRVHSVRRGIKAAAEASGLKDVSPHVLRHSAARHMIEAGIPISEVAQYLGHTSEKLTFSTYARFSPGYLRKAASALEYDDLAEFKRKKDDGGHGRD